MAESTTPALQKRVQHIVDNTRYMTLSVATGEGKPWCYPVAFVPYLNGFLYYTHSSALHSKILATNHHVAGSAYTTDEQGIVEDGIQFTGHITTHPRSEPPPQFDLAELQKVYWGDGSVDIPDEKFTRGNGFVYHHLTWDRVWLIDLSEWEATRLDRRIPVEYVSPTPS